MDINQTIEQLIPAYKGYFYFLQKNKEKLGLMNAETMANKSGSLFLSNIIVKQLLEHNKINVLEAIANGENNENTLLDILSNWETIYKNNDTPNFTFLGLRITTDCNLYGKDRCKYCNQKRYSDFLDKSVIIKNAKSIAKDGKIKGISASVSGGEPLIFVNNYLFGESGIINNLSKLGFTINMNSNLHMLSPKEALLVVESGLLNIHVSFDSSLEKIHDDLVCEGAFHRVLNSIRYIQLTKGILGIPYPNIHINVVGTKENLLYYDELFKLLISLRLDETNFSPFGSPYSNPSRMDMSPHLIPLGGNSNLQPSKEEWDSFENEIIPSCRSIWNKYLIDNNIVPQKYNSFDMVHFFANPYSRLRVGFSGLDQDKFPSKCYAAPTQVMIMPNGDCYPCSCHADNPKAKPLGNINLDSIQDIMQKNKDYLYNLPSKELCAKCPRSALNINNIVESKLRAHIRRWMLSENLN